MNKTAIEARLTGPDIVRVVAAFFMVAVHFFMECGYYAYCEADRPGLRSKTAVFRF